MKTSNTLLTLLLLISTVGTGISYANSQALQRRFDVMSCRLDVADARIDVLSGKPARHVPCLDALFPRKQAKGHAYILTNSANLPGNLYRPCLRVP